MPEEPLSRLAARVANRAITCEVENRALKAEVKALQQENLELRSEVAGLREELACGDVDLGAEAA